MAQNEVCAKLETSRSVTDEKLKQTQAQVNEITGIAQANIEKGLKRGVNFNALDSKVQDLEGKTQDFQKISNKTKKKFVFKNLKWTIVVILMFLMTIVLLGIGIGLSFYRKN